MKKIKEETGPEAGIVRLIGVYSDPERDPRGHSVTVAFPAAKVGGRLQDDDAADAKILDPESVELGFDHAEVIRDALAREA